MHDADLLASVLHGCGELVALISVSRDRECLRKYEARSKCSEWPAVGVDAGRQIPRPIAGGAPILVGGTCEHKSNFVAEADRTRALYPGLSPEDDDMLELGPLATSSGTGSVNTISLTEQPESNLQRPRIATKVSPSCRTSTPPQLPPPY